MRGAPKRLLVTVSARARIREATRWIQELGDVRVTVVAAGRAAGDELVRELLSEGSGARVQRTTPAQLAAALATARLAATGRAPVSGLGMEALAHRAVAAAREAGELGYFAPVATAPGLPRALARTFTELRLQNVDPQRLAGVGPAGDDLLVLWRRLVETLTDHGLADPAELWRLAGERIGDVRPHPLLDTPLLLLDPELRGEAEQVAYAALARRAPALLATLPFGDAEGIEALERALGVNAVLTGGESDSRLERLRRWVFADTTEGEGEGEPESDSSLEFLSAPGEGRECVEIARRILELGAEGTRFDRIAVLLRDPDGYLPLLEEAFRRARIPAFYTRGTIRPHPSGRAFLALLACAAENLSATRFAEYLSLGQVPALPPEAAELVEVPWVEPDGAQLVFKTLEARPEGRPPHDPADGRDPFDENEGSPVLAGTLQAPRRWERLLVDAAVMGGRERWQRRLRGLEAEFELRLREVDDDDHGRRRYLERQVVGVHNLERFALPLIDRLSALPVSTTWGHWLRALRELAVQALRSPDQVLAVLADLEPMNDVGPVDLGEVRRTLRDRLTFLRVEPAERRYGRVFVAAIEEARGQSFAEVFLPGLAEGVFPRRPAEDPLLLDEWRHVVGGGLADRQRRIERERLLLRIAAGAAEDRLVVSYPTVDALQGRARVPSFYALDVARAAEGTLPSADDLERRAAEAAAPRIGWPAPLDPGRAVDAAEYDVAVLAPMLTGDKPGERGLANYLVQVNETLARTLRTRWKRWQGAFSFADGLVNPGAEARSALDAHRLAARSYSPTALQSFAVCPYRFFLYAVHRLRPREEPAPLEQLDPLTRGSLFHEVQYQLLTRLRDEQELPISPDNRDRVTEIGDEVLDQQARSYAEELAPAIPRVWRDEIEGLRTDLRGWIRAVAELDAGWVPSYFEFAFGLGREPGRDPLGQRDEAVVLDGYRLRGSIDLVEQKAEGDVWRVTDHKTGKPLREKFVVVGRGEVLQPLLYALAAEYHLGGKVDAGRLFYCTRRGDYETREVTLNTDTRNKVGQVLGIVDRAVADGFLPAAPRERACDWCDFRSVCGPYEELRLRSKDRRSLAALELLRGAP